MVLTGGGGEGISRLALPSGPAETAHTVLTGGGGEGLEVLTGGGGEGMEVLTGSGEEGIGVALPAETGHTGLTGGGGEGLEVLTGGGGELTGSGGEGIGVALPSGPAETTRTGLTGGGGEGLEVLTGGGGEGMEVLTGRGNWCGPAVWAGRDFPQWTHWGWRGGTGGADWGWRGGNWCGPAVWAGRDFPQWTHWGWREVLTGGGGEGKEVLTGSGGEGIGVALPSGPAETARTGLTGGGEEGLEVLTGVEEVEMEFRDIDLEEQHIVEEFCRNGCGCSMNCVTQFSLKHLLLARANASQMHRSELDMAIMGQVMAFTFCSQVPQNSTRHRHQPKQRERHSAIFYHNGLRVCKTTFLFLHDIGDFRLRAIRAHYLSEGLVPRIHGHTGRTAPNALVLEDVRGIITFILQYVESNGILLPGRIPGYKRDDIKLLPSSTTKRAVWVLFQESCTSLSVRSVAYSTFCKVWRNFLSDVVVAKPMTDLCATCQKNNTAIVRSRNMSEEEKSEVCVCT